MEFCKKLLVTTRVGTLGNPLSQHINWLVSLGFYTPIRSTHLTCLSEVKALVAAHLPGISRKN